MIALSPLSMMKNAQIRTMFLNEGLTKQVPGFAFDLKYKEKPTTLGIDLIIDNVTYHYEFSVLGQKVVHELLTRKYRRTEKILERTSPAFQDILLKSKLKNFEDTKKVVKEDALCLAMAAMLNDKFANMVVDAIKGINVFNMTSPRLNPENQKRLQMTVSRNMLRFFKKQTRPSEIYRLSTKKRKLPDKR